MRYRLTIIIAIIFSITSYATELYNHSIANAVDYSRYTDIHLEDGLKGYLLNCAGLDGCYAIAGELCKSKGYETIFKKANKVNVNVFENSWVIKCK